MRWKIDAPWFGGWSAIEVTGNGTEMTAISDRGHLVEATLVRTNGRVNSVIIDRTLRLANAGGARLRNKSTDAEGLAIAANGRAYVSFEHRHRIMSANLSNGRTNKRIKLPFLDQLGENAGIEALAIGPDNTLYALSETAPSGKAPFPLYAYRNGKWRIAARIPQRGQFVPVGADFDSKGRLWLLERTVTPLGFRSRIRLFDFQASPPREYSLMTSIPARYDNLESISVWDDPSGRMHLTMISDDNFFPIQRTQIVEYRVIE